MEREKSMLNYRLLYDVLLMFKYPVFLIAMKNSNRAELVIEDAKKWGRKKYFEIFDELVHNSNFASVFHYRCFDSKVLCKIVQIFFKRNENIEINTPDVGGGLMIYHKMGCVVSAKKIGKGCIISQGVTIGFGGYGTGDEEKPVIGNNVRIATNAIVIGGISVGDNAVIGAGSVIVKDVPENAIVVGNPQRVLRYLSNSKKVLT